MLDLVDQVLVQLDEAAQEAQRELKILLPVRELLRGLLEVVEAAAKIGYVVAQGEEALARHLFADEIADQ